MRILIIVSVFSCFMQTLSGQGYSNIVFGHYLHHSENDEPSTWTKPIENFYSCDLGFESRLEGHRLIQVGIGYEENFNALVPTLDIDPDYGNRTRLNREQSLPVYARMAWSSKGMTAYGLGPLYSPAKHTFIVDLSRLAYHREITYSHALGITGFVRFSTPLSEHLFALLTLEGRYVRGLWFQGGGQDLSDYEYANIQIRLGVGMGRKR